jgi:hypothetical protein
MKRLVFAVALATAVVCAVLGAQAASGTSRSRAVPQSATNAALVQAVNTLAKRVKALERKTKVLQNRVAFLTREVSANYAGDACALALTADELQDTWGVIDQISSATQGGKTYFGPQSALDDKGACEALSNPTVPRMPVSSTTIPNIRYFNPMIQWIAP